MLVETPQDVCDDVAVELGFEGYAHCTYGLVVIIDMGQAPECSGPGTALRALVDPRGDLYESVGGDDWAVHASS